jgi:hypothetical protein
MPLPIVLALAAAGAVAGGGFGAAAGGMFMWKRTNQAAGRELARADTDALAALYEAEIDLARTKQQARDVGVDVSAVEAGYRAYRDGQVDLQAIAEGVMNGAYLIPTAATADPQNVRELVGDDIHVVSDRDMRRWLRERGHDVPAAGPLAERLKVIYREGNPRTGVAHTM